MDRHDEPSYLCKKHNKDNMDKDYNKGISRRSALNGWDCSSPEPPVWVCRH